MSKIICFIIGHSDSIYFKNTGMARIIKGECKCMRCGTKYWI